VDSGPDPGGRPGGGPAAEAVEAALQDEPPTADAAGASEEDYPALRALLRDMAGVPGSSGSQDAGAGPEATDEEAPSGSQNILGKRSA